MDSKAGLDRLAQDMDQWRGLMNMAMTLFMFHKTFGNSLIAPLQVAASKEGFSSIELYLFT
jgi:hypothetical protein